MKKRIGLWIFLIVILPAAGVFAEDKVVEAEGISYISKEDAIRQAQRAAVEQGVGVFIHSETETENYVLQKDKILSRTQGYVKQFKVLTEVQSNGNYTAKIRATVSLDKIKDDLMALKILLDSMERPKLMILIEEDYLDMAKPQMRIAETELSAQLQAKGFELVDKTQVEQAKAQDKARQALAGNLEAASSLGLAFGAQYVILGKAVVQDIGEAIAGTGMRSLQSSMQLKVVQSQSGLLLGSVVKNGVAAHISPLTGATLSLKEAVQKTVDDYLVNAVTESFQDYLNNGAPLKLYITNIKTFRQYKEAVADIESMKQVASSKKEGWNKTSGLLVLDLRYKGTSEELAELLDGRKFGGQGFEVTDFGPDRVDCQVK
ncbi:MAG: hypothetical protein ACOZF0_13995 [Thermodesulfobacteriota bacterium]